MKTQGIAITGKKARHYKFLQTLRGGRRVHAKMVDLIDAKSGDKILDVGSGPGTFLLLLAKKYGNSVKLHGIDPSEDMIKIASFKKNTKVLDIDFKIGAGEQIEFESNKFSWVVSSLVFHHMPRYIQEQTAREIHRVLKPGGKVVISDWEKPENLFARILGFLLRNHAFIKENNKGSVAESLRKAGFQKVETAYKQFGIIAHLTGIK